MGAVIAVAALAATSASAFRGHHVYVANRGCVGHTVRPGRIVIACADGQVYATGIHYSSYGRRKARGQGTVWRNDCNPDCANGTVTSHPARIVLSRILRCGSRYFYGEISWKYTDTAPPSGSSGRANIKPFSPRCTRVT